MIPEGWTLGPECFWPFKDEYQAGPFIVRVVSITFPRTLGGRKRARMSRRATKHLG